jgi:hypothetical protein
MYIPPLKVRNPSSTTATPAKFRRSTTSQTHRTEGRGGEKVTEFSSNFLHFINLQFGVQWLTPKIDTQFEDGKAKKFIEDLKKEREGLKEWLQTTTDEAQRQLDEIINELPF